MHKLRNVTEQLPETMRLPVKKAMQQAYAARSAKSAKRLLTNLLKRLRSEHPGAAGSLEEGLDETLTVMSFGLSEWLERTLSTTNAVENLIGSVRNLGHRVRRWRDGKMIVRWAVTALIEASKQFRKLRGYSGMGISSCLRYVSCFSRSTFLRRNVPTRKRSASGGNSSDSPAIGTNRSSGISPAR